MTSLSYRLHKKTHSQHWIDKTPTKILNKNLNTTSKHLKSSHSENGETHLTIIYCLPKSDSYSCLNITRQKKENAIATSTRNPTQRVITSLLSNPPSHYWNFRDLSSISLSDSGNILTSRSTSSLNHRFITSHQSWHPIKNASRPLHSLSFHGFISHPHHNLRTSLQLNSNIFQTVTQTMSNV